MISPKEAAVQIERLSGLDFYPRGQDQAAAVKELRLAAEAAKTPEILREVIDDWVSGQRECPKPADLRRLIWERSEPGSVSTVPEKRNCNRCQDCGIYGGVLAGQFAGPWKWCDCQAGIDLRLRAPQVVMEANQGREQLIRRFAASKAHDPLVQAARQIDRQPVEEYRGAF